MVPSVQHRFTWPLMVSVFYALLGSLLSGFHMGNMKSLQSIVESFFSEVYWGRYQENISQELKNALWITAVAIFYLGAALSSGFSTPMARYYGRRKSILLCSVMFLVAATLMAGCRVLHSIEALIIGRFLMGVVCGLTMNLNSLYIKEISSFNHRKTLSTMHSVSVACGAMAGQLLSLDVVLGTDGWWTWMMAISLIPAILQLLSFPWCPESPRYLIIVEKREEAENALQKLRGTSDVWMEMDNIKGDVLNMKEEMKLSQLLSQYRKPFSIVLTINATTRLNGFSKIVKFSTKTLLNAVSSQTPRMKLGSGLIKITSIVLSALLVEKVGRKRFLLVGQLSLAICNILLIVSEATLTLHAWIEYGLAVIYICICTYQMRSGSISKCVAADLLPPEAQPAALGYTKISSWSLRFLGAIVGQSLKDSMGPCSYLIFATVQIAAAVTTRFYLPDVKEKNSRSERTKETV